MGTFQGLSVILRAWVRNIRTLDQAAVALPVCLAHAGPASTDMGDPGKAGWVSLLGGGASAVPGSAPGFPKSIKTREKLSEYLTVVIFTASAQHAAVNFGQVGRGRARPRAGNRQGHLDLDCY